MRFSRLLVCLVLVAACAPTSSAKLSITGFEPVTLRLVSRQQVEFDLEFRDERGELVEPFGSEGRIGSPFGYWLLRWRVRLLAPHLQAFEAWVLEQAAQTRAAMQLHR